MYTQSSYDHATWAGDTLYVSGQVASDADGKIVAPGDAAGQAKQVWASVGRVLRPAHTGLVVNAMGGRPGGRGGRIPTPELSTPVSTPHGAPMRGRGAVRAGRAALAWEAS